MGSEDPVEIATTADRALGARLVAAGRLTQEQLVTALEQQRQHGGAARVRLGEILVQQGLVTVQDVQQVLADQGKRILYCPRCKVQVNARGAQPGGRYACQQCGGVLEEPKLPASPAVTDSWSAIPALAPRSPGLVQQAPVPQPASPPPPPPVGMSSRPASSPSQTTPTQITLSSEDLADEVQRALADPSRRVGRYAIVDHRGRYVPRRADALVDHEQDLDVAAD